MRSILAATLVVVSMVLTACGGGGGGSDPATNPPPVLQQQSIAFAQSGHLRPGDSVVLIGGSGATGALTDAWFSTDAVTWQLATAAVPHLPRGGTSLRAYNGALWLMGGNRLQSSNGFGELKFSNDIWTSADGATWAQVPAGPRFTPRAGASLVEFNNALWLIGGNDQYGPRSDAWTSTDGVQWRIAYTGAIAYP